MQRNIEENKPKRKPSRIIPIKREIPNNKRRAAGAKLLMMC